VEEIVRALKGASREIYDLIHQPMDESYYRYEGVGAGGDRSSKIDLAAEAIFCRHLEGFGRIHSEESGERGEGPYEIILDPIDGSDNLLSRFPYYGSSVAVKEDGVTKLSFIVNFANADFFVKTPHIYKKGSLLHDRLKDVRPHSMARIGIFEKAYANPDVVLGLKKEGLKFRSPGAVALSLAYARYVNFVLFVGPIRPYDVEAGLHQCQGLYTYVDEGAIVVSGDKEIFDKIKAHLPKGR